jgi:hypothetical protein
MVRVRVSPEMEPQSGHAMPSRIPAAVARSGSAVSREESGDGEAVGEIAPAIWRWQEDEVRGCHNCCVRKRDALRLDCDAVFQPRIR